MTCLTSDSGPCGGMIILMDNGSLEPAATLGLRALAARLSTRLGRPVAPVSLLHSAAIPPDLIGGVPAETLEAFINRRASAGVFEFSILPLFFGPSLALSDYLPKRLTALRARHPALVAQVAPCLCGDETGESMVAQMLADRVREAAGAAWPRIAVMLCDHGSPVREVTEVRNRLAARLQVLLAVSGGVTPASMERREGPEYDFNDPLLATALESPPAMVDEVVVAMQFLLPGRHAGQGGDVEQICAAAVAERPGLQVRRTELLAGHALLDDLLLLRASHLK